MIEQFFVFYTGIIRLIMIETHVSFFASFEEVKLYSHYINIHYACFMINIFEYMYAKNMLLIKISTK